MACHCLFCLVSTSVHGVCSPILLSFNFTFLDNLIGPPTAVFVCCCCVVSCICMLLLCCILYLYVVAVLYLVFVCCCCVVSCICMLLLCCILLLCCVVWRKGCATGNHRDENVLSEANAAVFSHLGENIGQSASGKEMVCICIMCVYLYVHVRAVYRNFSKGGGGNLGYGQKRGGGGENDTRGGKCPSPP